MEGGERQSGIPELDTQVGSEPGTSGGASSSSGPQACPRCDTGCEHDSRYCRICGASLDRADAVVLPSNDPLIGRVIADRYRISRLVGRGGMGVVYRAEHVHMGKTLAVKLLHGEMATQRDQLRRFKREAEAISRLSNIHTVQVFDYGRSQGLVYLVMEYLDGRDVGNLLRSDKRLALLRTCMILVQICESLVEAHEAGIVHRDLKPENVILIERKGMQDFVKVLDFGLAKMRVDIGGRPDDTAHGAILGTPYYMSPEQIRGEEIDHRADVYALGGLMFMMLSGRPPYRAPTPLAVMAKHLTEPVPPLEPEGMDEDQRASANEVVGRCLAKDRLDRYGSVEELRSDLLGIIERFYMPGTTPQGLARGALEEATAPASGRGVQPRETLRGEFERWERKLKVRRAALLAVPVIAACAVAALAITLAVQGLGSGSRGDVEPNNVPAQASVLDLGETATGSLGKRLSVTESDHDWWVFEVPGPGLSLVRIHLRRLPNIDTMLEVFESGAKNALAASRSGGPGEDEAVGGLLLEPGRYFVLVRQDLARLGRPLESISDTYTLEASILDASVWEVEPDDSVQSAVPLSKGKPRKGFIQGPQDRDFFCALHPAGKVRVEAPAGLVLRAAVIDLATGWWHFHEAGETGKDIVVALPAGAGEGDGPCIQISSAAGTHDNEAHYTITLE